MARSRLNVSPKTTSHRTGWTARVTSSVRSCFSFCSSTRQKVTTREPSRRAPRTGRESWSAQMDGAPGAADTAQPSSPVLEEVAARDVEQPGEPHDVLTARQPSFDGQLLGDVAQPTAHRHRLVAQVMSVHVHLAVLQRPVSYTHLRAHETRHD